MTTRGVDRRFTDRSQAGRLLAERLAHLRPEAPVVLALPRGGVPVAYEVAQTLGAPLDVILVRKLGVPYQPELAMGAISEEGVRVLNDDLIRRARVTQEEIARIEDVERSELSRRAQRFRGYRPPLLLQGRTVIVVDDGIATGATARAALRLVSHRGAGRVVLAVPVGPPETAGAFGGEADEVVVLLTPANFVAVGYWYDDFSQVTDEQVARLLVASDLTTQRNDADPPAVDEEVEVV